MLEYRYQYRRYHQLLLFLIQSFSSKITNMVFQSRIITIIPPIKRTTASSHLSLITAWLRPLQIITMTAPSQITMTVVI
jgi:hypothetical protein